MFIEKRKEGKHVKYYLVHSYREKNEVKKLRKYLGQGISSRDLKTKIKETKKQLLELAKELSTEVFFFSLTKKQIETLNNYNDKITIAHLNKEELKRFTEQFVYNTNAIEGSTVTEKEVKKILAKKKQPKNNDEMETKNVAEAFKYIQKTKGDLSLELIKKLHLMCFKDSKHFAGKLRNLEVCIRNAFGEIVHQGVPKEKVTQALEELVAWYKNNKKKFKPIVLAAIIHNQFEHIHPFQDGNGRVGRLLLNFILLKNKYPPINITLEDRWKYYLTLQEYSKHGNLKQTLLFLIEQYKKSINMCKKKK